MKTPYLKFLIIPASALIALLINTPVWAINTIPTGVADPQRSCVIKGGRGGKSLTIIAGPDLNDSGSTDPIGEFPETVDCGSDTCSKWNYRYIWNKMNPSHAYADMSADLALTSTSTSTSNNNEPGHIYDSLGPNNMDTRWIRWTSNEKTFDASFVTPTATPRIASAGGKAGKFEGFCAILGAGVPVPGEQKPAQDTLVAEKLIRTADGVEICTLVDPVTQCETGIDCATREELPSKAIKDLILAHELPVIEISIPGQACPTFVTYDGEDDTRYYCSGGRCYYYPGF